MWVCFKKDKTSYIIPWLDIGLSVAWSILEQFSWLLGLLDIVSSVVFTTQQRFGEFVAREVYSTSGRVKQVGLEKPHGDVGRVHATSGHVQP